jgi:hypothetical protein
MAGTADRTQPDLLPLRASDAEREEAIAALRERFAAGQLTQDTFVGRMEAALTARHQRELAELFTDLPAPQRRGGLPAWSDRAAASLGRLRRWPRTAPGMASHLSAALEPAKDAAAAWARLARTARRSSRLPGLTFPAGSRTSFTIGRDPGCDLVLADISVSRRHAGLDRVVSGWVLTDLGSTNGTRLNGWRIREPVPVRAGDRVTFGVVTFKLRT